MEELELEQEHEAYASFSKFMEDEQKTTCGPLN